MIGPIPVKSKIHYLEIEKSGDGVVVVPLLPPAKD